METTKLTAKEIIEILNENELYDGSLFRYASHDVESITSVLGNHGVVHEEGGGEGEGEHVEVVVHFAEHDVYLASYASYYSHHGIDYWQEWQEVKPVEVLVTQYNCVAK